MDDKDLIAAACEDLKYRGALLKEAGGSLSQDIRQVWEIAKNYHPSERIQFATTLIQSAARDPETEPGIREKLLNLMRQLDRIGDAW